MAFLVGVACGARYRHPHLDAPSELAPPGDACVAGWSKTAELTHGASFLPPPGGGGAWVQSGMMGNRIVREDG